jgi:SHS2 domain-containing protein
MKNYELIEHTADIGIRVKGKDLEELFKNTALAMFDIIAERRPHPSVHRPQTANITVIEKADNLEELFINWLNELLSLSAAKELIFSDFVINKIGKNALQALAIGENIKDYKINTEIKAATYHQLKLEQTESGWQVEVIFDV